MNKESYPDMKFPLWVPRSVNETLDIYAKWAASYDADLIEAGYESPKRIAEALIKFATLKASILDFGCGTGLSGKALCDVGFKKIDGMDISPEMLVIARERGLYDQLWQSKHGEMTDVRPGKYDIIVAAGVVSLGAAPPETLSILVDQLSKNGLIGLSYNDPTIEDGSYDIVLESEIKKGRIKLLFRENGPHLSQKSMGSDVIILKRL